ncbi:Acid phosphatase [Psilocybe cubensis]|uniref:Acid phosphatase n=2 Tax=Psilocybe cubensis TaxID=181762 RepID=A0ACB8GFU6_PSICU|nr:Acid phosphatase [Psilocybe cubensis]KAH9474489.1 Acid phosphatase [Psilocybe cubensis]
MLLSTLLSATVILGVVAAPPPDHDHQPPKHNKIVPGIVFDRFISIWLENTDSTDAQADPNFAALTQQSLRLTNYFAVTHPSEPNYVASVGGEYFGMQNDNLNRIPANISTIVDLLEEKGISWAEYQEDMPETGFQGFQQLAPSGANDYVRKHNPLIIYDSVANSTTRSANIKNFTLFEQDLASNNIPQWLFITPNMTNDGHDTNITFASSWARGFLEPLLKNPHFNGPKTLILLTFDESGSDGIQNRVDSILLGNAVPKHLIGTEDSSFYTHYSGIATIEANWNLHTLGRYDVGANVFSFVAEKTGDKLRTLENPPLSETFLNASYPGVFNTGPKAPLPIPNTRLVVNGRFVHPKVVEIWGSPALQSCTTYTDSVQVPSLANPPVLPAGCL